jgi:hypothetical protein
LFEALKTGETPASYREYHLESMKIGDVDPSYEMLRYVCNRFELNMEQRFWLAFLYATCYCGPTVYYIYNEFPDFENVDEGRLQRWWSENKSKLYFQTDRRRIRSNDQFCAIFRSYKEKVGTLTQEQLFNTFKSPIRGEPFASQHTYDLAWREMSDLYQFGRFSMFLYLEAVHVVTGFKMRPSSMKIEDAESCRNGLAFAIARNDLLTLNDERLNPKQMKYLQAKFDRLCSDFQRFDTKNSVWNIETTLCAYKKYRLGKRWVGYYLDRQADEITWMQDAVKTGVDWSVLWDYRRETYDKKFLKELK